MSESKHTPGPWFVDEDQRPDMEWNRHIYGPDGLAVCFMAHSDGKDVARDEANAALIARAPDLAAEVERLKTALTKINGIRDSIIGCQKVNWSEHIYPLVAALEAAGFEGASYEVARNQIGTLMERTNKAEAEVERLREENDKLRAKLGNSPEPCAYCGIPADKLLECRHGFPGCPRADDMMLCGHFGAAMEADEVREALAAEVERLREIARDAAEYATRHQAEVLDLRRKVEALEHALKMSIIGMREAAALLGETQTPALALAHGLSAALAATEGGE